MKPLKVMIGLAVPLLLGANAARAQTVTSNLIVGVDPAQTIALLTTGGNPPSLFSVSRGSNMVFRLADPLCSGACTGDLNYLRVTMGTFSQPLTIAGPVGGQANITFTNPTLMIVGPVPMQTDGLQSIVPVGTVASFTATISGTANVGSNNVTIPSQLVGSDLTTTSPLLISIDVGRQIMAFQGEFPFRFQANGTVEGTDVSIDLPGSARVIGSGISPFADIAPVAVGTVPAQVGCGQPVTLDATGSSDANGPQDIAQFRWTRPDGTLLATGRTTSVTLPAGTHVIVLHVIDLLGIEGTRQFTVTVAGDRPPVFTTVPAPVHAATCGAVALTPPPATSACGFPVTVTSNAPAFFPAGRTTVTWTARSSSGLTSTITQLVVVALGDSAACCPAGSRVVVGTSNNDTLNGTAGVDCIIGLGGQDVINGAGGDDIISGGDGDDQITGGTGNDVINGGTGQDRLSGDDGNDDLNGGGGDDTLTGGNGDDILNGGGNNDRCTGGAGFDLFTACVALDTIDKPTVESDAFNVCQCKPNKCVDCSVQAAACTATAGCPTIIGCVSATESCNLPHECSSACESGLSQQAISAARLLGSCMGGCQ